MKVYLQPPQVKSLSLKRVALMLERYAPAGVRIVDDMDAADLTVLHAIGRQDALKRQVEACGPYAVIQYCIRSTLRPSTEGWLPIWQDALTVWSYLDLPALCSEDEQPDGFPFYHAPLGVDAEIFQRSSFEADFLIATSGYSALTESVKEAILAARRVGGKAFHLGPDPQVGDDVTSSGEVEISDQEVANYFSRCRFVSGLRRVEGFELPAAEGLLCGARPIFFDRPHYRRWFDEWGIFIPEAPREAVIDSLTAVFKTITWPVSDKEIRDARKRFDWQTLVSGFWDRCLN